MGRELTKRHSSLFKQKVLNPFIFANDVYKYGKSRELASFIVWELFHTLRLFPQNKYLQFNNSEGLTLEKEGLHEPSFDDKLTHLFTKRGATISKCDHNWKRIFINNNGDIYGCVYPNDRSLFKSTDKGESLILLTTFRQPIKSLFVSSRNTVFVCVKGAVYTSSDEGNTFMKSLELASSESFFRYNNAITETPDKTVILGEYGNVWENNGWKNLAYLYSSSDNGKTWEKSDFLIKQGINKHVHLVKYSRLLNQVLVADGDNKKKLWVSDSVKACNVRNIKWKPVNKYHIQTGGYTSAVENGDKILFGTDYQGGTNFIVETTDGKRFRRKIVPDPYRRSFIDNMVQRKSKRGNEIWANLPFSTAKTRCLLMYTADEGSSWNKAIEYTKGCHRVTLISSSNDIRDDMYFSIENVGNGDRKVYKICDAQ